MKVAELGEFGLIDAMSARLRTAHRGLLVGIGDDAAVWRSPRHPLIATTDALLEGIHFDLRSTSWYELGWKSIAVNMSDIAAMGGAPDYALVVLAIPEDTSVDAVTELARGMHDIGDRFDVAVMGGDTVQSPRGVCLAVTLFGHTIRPASSTRAKPDTPAYVLTRRTARPGDMVAVTGFVGTSAAGLAALRQDQPVPPEAISVLRAAHNSPCPRVKEGQVLLLSGVTAAMDVSDGTAGDLAKICRASGVSARLRIPDLPIRPEVRTAFPDRSSDFALYGGEDYELLFTAPRDVMASAARRVETETGTPVTNIGEITDGPAGLVTVVDHEGNETPIRMEGYDHFAHRD